MNSKDIKSKICLNMIVRDESHVILETLETIYKYIDFYVICDTGSIDNTKILIKDFFNKKNIKGEILDHIWYDDFGINRTMALKACKIFCEKLELDYIWVIDADDILIGFIELSNLNKDCYALRYGNEFTYPRSQIFKAELDWEYYCVRHEFPSCSKENYTYELIKGDYYIESRRQGSRNNNPNKYLDDALKLEESILRDNYKDNSYKSREIFYCGQSYFDYGDFEKSLKWYKKRISMDGWFEEVYESYYKIALCYQNLNKSLKKTVQKFLEAFKYIQKISKNYPTEQLLRAEPLYEICQIYRIEEDYENSYYYGKYALSIPYPKDSELFVHKDIYDYKLLDEMSVSSYYIGQWFESYYLSKKLLLRLESYNKDEYYNEIKERVKDNIKYSYNMLIKIKSETNPKILILFLNQYVNNKNKNINLLVDVLSKKYNIIIVNGNNYETNKDIITFNQEFFLEALISKEIKPNILLIYDNLYINHYLGDKIKDYFEKIYLINKDIDFKILLPNDGKVYIYNDKILNKLFKYIDKIIIPKYENNIISMKKYYDLDEKHFLNIDSFIINIDNIKSKIGLKVNIDNPDCSSNGIILENPNYINVSDKKSLELYYNQIIEFFPNYPEPFCFLAKHYFSYDKVKAKETFEKALDLIKGNKDNNYPFFKQYIKTNIGSCLYELGEYEKSFNKINKVLKNLINEDDRIFIQNCRDKNINYFKDKYLKYPEKKIQKLQNKEKITTLLSITSCKRLDLFEKTLNSFINCCKDYKKIDFWLCVDDNSYPEQREYMKKRYPFFHFIWKNEENKGHYKSMNIIYDFIKNNNVKYLLHLEDDWHFIQPLKFIKECKEILNENDLYGQVLFNKNYSEIPGQNIIGGFNKITKKGKIYSEHDYDEFFLENNPDFPYNSVHFWPHFSLRPSFIRCSTLLDIGPFYNTYHFEMGYATEYIERGYISCFLNTFSCIHIGKKTWENENVKKNSYVLNGFDQFSSSDEINIFVFNIDGNKDNWKNFKNKLKDKENIKGKFFRQIIYDIDKNKILSFLKIIEIEKEREINYPLMILDDNFDFKINFNEFLQNINSYDLLLIDENNFILSKNAIDKIFTNINKIKSTEDIFYNLDIKVLKLEEKVLTC